MECRRTWLSARVFEFKTRSLGEALGIAPRIEVQALSIWRCPIWRWGDEMDLKIDIISIQKNWEHLRHEVRVRVARLMEILNVMRQSGAASQALRFFALRVSAFGPKQVPNNLVLESVFQAHFETTLARSNAFASSTVMAFRVPLQQKHHLSLEVNASEVTSQLVDVRSGRTGPLHFRDPIPQELRAFLMLQSPAELWHHRTRIGGLNAVQ